MKRHLAFYVMTVGLLGMLEGCEMPTFSTDPIYNSNDHSSLPCESHLYEVFFPVEFDKNGEYLFKERQVIPLLEEVEKRSAERVRVNKFRGELNRLFQGGNFERDKLEKLKGEIVELQKNELTDLFVFLHGWDKTPSAAELDYQDFICRILAKPRGTTKTHSLVVGVFWPSTLRPNSPVSFPLFSYIPIRSRADTLASEGVKQLLLDLGSKLKGFYGDPRPSTRLHVVGHSFGARIAIKALGGMYDILELDTSKLTDCDGRSFQRSSENKDEFGFSERRGLSLLLRNTRLDLILLNAAVSRDSLTGLGKSLKDFFSKVNGLYRRVEELQKKQYDRTITPDEEKQRSCIKTFLPYQEEVAQRLQFDSKHVRIYNIYSKKDWTIAWLYWLVEGLDEGLGASPYGDHPVQVDDFGEIENWRNEESHNGIWDVNASAIINDHSDIYKGRVVFLIRQIIEHRNESLKPSPAPTP